MTHGKIFKYGARGAYERRGGIHKERKVSCEGSNGTGGSIRYFQASSLSLCPRSRGGWERGTGSRYKDGLYGEDTQKSDQGTSEIFKNHWGKLERDSHSSTSSFYPKRSGAWLKGRNPLRRSSWNTALTDCQGKRLSKLISFWFLTKFGKGVLQNSV